MHVVWKPNAWRERVLKRLRTCIIEWTFGAANDVVCEGNVDDARKAYMRGLSRYKNERRPPRTGINEGIPRHWFDEST